MEARTDIWRDRDGNEIREIPEGAVGFSYRIENEITGTYYIGKKLCVTAVKAPPLKGRVRKRTKIRETSWRSYEGSSNKLRQLIDAGPGPHWKKTVIHWARSKSHLAWLEHVGQLEGMVWGDSKCLNEMCHVRIRFNEKLISEIREGPL